MRFERYVLAVLPAFSRHFSVDQSKALTPKILVNEFTRVSGSLNDVPKDAKLYRLKTITNVNQIGKTVPYDQVLQVPNIPQVRPGPRFSKKKRSNK